MHKPAFFALILAATLACGTSRADEWQNSCPLVCETYDCLLVTHQPWRSDYDGSTGCTSKVYFVRKSRIIADRVVADSMRLHVDGENWVLDWFDFGCHRRITAPLIIEVEVTEDIEAHANGQPWFGAARRMTDLVPAPEPDLPPAPPVPGGAP